MRRSDTKQPPRAQSCEKRRRCAERISSFGIESNSVTLPRGCEGDRSPCWWAGQVCTFVTLRAYVHICDRDRCYTGRYRRAAEVRTGRAGVELRFGSRPFLPDGHAVSSGFVLHRALCSEPVGGDLLCPLSSLPQSQPA